MVINMFETSPVISYKLPSLKHTHIRCNTLVYFTSMDSTIIILTNHGVFISLKLLSNKVTELEKPMQIIE